MWFDSLSGATQWLMNDCKVWNTSSIQSMIPYTQNVLILTSTATKVMGFFPKYDSGILQAGFIGFGYEFPANQLGGLKIPWVFPGC